MRGLHVDEELHRVVVAAPVLGIDPGEEAGGRGGPAPPQVVGEVAQPLHVGGQLDVGDLEGTEVHLLPFHEAFDLDPAVALHALDLEPELAGRAVAHHAGPRPYLAPSVRRGGRRRSRRRPPAGSRSVSMSRPLRDRFRARAAKAAPVAPRPRSISRVTAARTSRRRGTCIRRKSRSSQSPGRQAQDGVGPRFQQGELAGAKSPRARATTLSRRVSGSSRRPLHQLDAPARSRFTRMISGCRRRAAALASAAVRAGGAPHCSYRAWWARALRRGTLPSR